MLPQKSLTFHFTENRRSLFLDFKFEGNFEENRFLILILAALIGPSKFVHVKYVLGSGWVSICAHGERGLNLSTYIHSGADFIQSGAKTFTCLLRTLSRNIWMESFIDRALILILILLTDNIEVCSRLSDVHHPDIHHLRHSSPPN